MTMKQHEIEIEVARKIMAFCTEQLVALSNVFEKCAGNRNLYERTLLEYNIWLAAFERAKLEWQAANERTE